MLVFFVKDPKSTFFNCLTVKNRNKRKLKFLIRVCLTGCILHHKRSGSIPSFKKFGNFAASSEKKSISLLLIGERKFGGEREGDRNAVKAKGK